ncbi:MAG: hypothetical protein ACT4PV_16660 [Planctomycetaceae bacterium]
MVVSTGVAGAGVLVGMLLLLLLVVFGWVRLRSRFRRRWWFAFPICYPLFPAFLVGAILLPILGYETSRSVYVFETEGDSLQKREFRSFLAGAYRLRGGGWVPVPPRGEEPLLINDSGRALELVVARFEASGGSTERIPMPVGASATLEGGLHFLPPGEDAPESIVSNYFGETRTYVRRP